MSQPHSKDFQRSKADGDQSKRSEASLLLTISDLYTPGRAFPRGSEAVTSKSDRCLSEACTK
eukprot:6245517-Pyramimonas_sp.AAC.3